MLYHHSINNLLKFPENFCISLKETQNGESQLLITLARAAHKCPCCGSSTSQIHDYREQTVQDLPLHSLLSFASDVMSVPIVENAFMRRIPF